MKQCFKCKSFKENEEFHNDKSRKDGLYPVCKVCKTANDRLRRKNNPERYREISNKWDKKNPDKKRNGALKREYGITLEEYNVILAKQNKKCAICLRDKSEFKVSMHLDHDHITGKIRGILCASCNRVLGLLKDNPENLERALVYLKA